MLSMRLARNVWSRLFGGAGALVVALPAASADLASSPYASLPLVRDDAPSNMPIARVAIGVLLLLAFVMWFLSRRFRGKSPSFNTLLGMPRAHTSDVTPRVRSVTRLSGNASLHVVEWQGRTLLIACAGETVTVLECMPADVASVNDAPVACSE
ncbi:flagellar biosynthetic protein FliO [Pandoraea pnomenusa]|uniref:flagellar biosynthetic protein FliO n=1 Tax=Pandoraea pnomenusa TaxID=93220 RepID=UPI001146195B|nr:flagellar biosynthetic protein FliO [Pandoraea pnomenusa]QDH60154.1 hypothetical protein FKQ53_13240 [Pandoraea pnomenusa]